MRRQDVLAVAVGVAAGIVCLTLFAGGAFWWGLNQRRAANERAAAAEAAAAEMMAADQDSRPEPEETASTSAHNELLVRLAARMQSRGWLAGDSPEILRNPLVFIGNQGVRPPDSAFDTYVKLSEERDDTWRGYIWVMVHNAGRLHFRQIDEPYRLALELATEFPAEERDLIDKMLRAAERVYQRDVLQSTESELTGDFEVVPGHGIEVIKGKRVGEPDYWRYDVRVKGTTDAYEIEAWLMEERYEEDRSNVDLKLVPRAKPDNSTP